VPLLRRYSPTTLYCAQMVILRNYCVLYFSEPRAVSLHFRHAFVTVALWNRADHCIFSSCGFFLLSIFFFSPNLSGRTLDVYHTSTTLSGYIFATKACRQSEKNLLSSNIFPTCSHNMVNFGPLAAEIVSLALWHPR